MKNIVVIPSVFTRHDSMTNLTNKLMEKTMNIYKILIEFAEIYEINIKIENAEFKLALSNIDVFIELDTDRLFILKEDNREIISVENSTEIEIFEKLESIL